jgi:hypothetical protein
MKTVKIISEHGIVAGTRVINTETGAEIPGVQSITINMPSAEDIVTADLRVVLVEAEVNARPRFFASYADSDGRGWLREVAKIIWADGGSTDFD